MTVTDLLSHGLVTTFWVSVLAILVLMVRKPVTERLGARAAMLLWMIPFARLVMPTLPRMVPAAPEAPPAPEPKMFASTMAPATEIEINPLIEPIGAEPGTMAAMEIAPVMDIRPIIEPVAAPSVWDRFADLGMSWTEVMAVLALSLWCAGMVLSGAHCWLRVRRWRETILAEAQGPSAQLSKLVKRACARVGINRAPKVVLSAAAATPQLLGLRDPIVALPTDFFDRFDDDEQEMALVHELVHLRRGDLFIMLATEAALALQWFNPLIARVRKAVRDDQEAACDETVRGLGFCRQRYAALLVKAASRGRVVPALTLDHSLKERIILMASPISSPSVRGVVAATAILGSAGFAAATASYTDVLVERTETVETNETSTARDDNNDQWKERSTNKGSSASYWDRHRTSADDDHLYKAYNAGANVTAERRATTSSRRSSASDNSPVTWRHDSGMVLLSDPFAGIEPPTELALEMPEPPQPPVPAIEEREVDGGRWIFVPDEPDMSAFEDAMKEFEAGIEAWSAEMEAFGDRMETVGDAVEELAEACDQHQQASDAPKILTEGVKGTSDKVRAVCVRGGMERFRSAELRRFVAEQDLSAEERAFFETSIRRRG